MSSRRTAVLTSLLALVLAACDGGSPPAHPVGASSFGNVTWSSVGPVNGPAGASGKLNAVAVDPTNPSVLYTAGGSPGNETPTQAGIYGTTDGGADWKPLDHGLVDAKGFTVGIVNDLSLDPQAPAVLVAATSNGIYRSTDSGADWKLTGANQLDTVQFARLGHAIYAAAQSGVLVSDDDGATWSMSLADPAGTAQVNALTASGSTVYAGFDKAAPVYEFENGTWTARGKAPAGVHQLAVDPFDTKRVYASVNNGSYDQNLYGSVDSGGAWTQISYPKVLGAQAIAFSTVVPHRFYLGGDSGGGLYYTTGSGADSPQWTPAFTPGVDRRRVLLAPNAAKTDDQCWVTTDQGLFWSGTCSTDGGSKKALSTGIANYLVTDFAVNPSGQGLAVTLQDYNATFTADAGHTWQRAAVPEDGAAAVNPGDGNICYLYRHGLAKSSTGCGDFTATDKTLNGPTFNSGVIAFDPSDPKTMYVVSGKGAAPLPTGAGTTEPDNAGTDPDATAAPDPDSTAPIDPDLAAPAGQESGAPGIYVSKDGGSTFTDTGWKLDDPTAIAIDPANRSHIVVVDDGKVLVSTNGGTTWNQAAGPARDGYSVAFVPNQAGLVLLAGPDGIWRSTDGGKSFTRTGADAQKLHQIACNPSGGSTPVCAAASESGLFASQDLGVTWTRIDQHTITHKFTSIRWLNGYLYTGTYGQGVIRTDQPLQRPTQP